MCLIVELIVYGTVLLCIVNFSAEKPSSSPNDPDYVPSIFVFSNNITAVNKQNKSRWKRLANRHRKNNYQLHETRVALRIVKL